MKPILIALMVVVGVADGQEKIYVFTPDTVKMKRAGWVLDYSDGLIEARRQGGFMEFMVGMRRAEPKSRTEKKAELQEASKRSADFEEVLREVEGKHDCLAGLMRVWKEYERECEPKDSTWEKYDVFVAPHDVYVKFPGIPKLYLKKGEKLQYPIEISYSTTMARTPTFEGFIDYLKRRKK